MTTTARIVGIESRPLAIDPPLQILTLELNDPLVFAAGQYLEVLHPDGTTIPLSIASPPESLPVLRLHYRSTPGMVAAERMDELLQGRHLELRGGAGEICLLPEDACDLFLIAGGTGISQALCLAEAQCARHPESAVALLACADAEADFYYRDLLPDSPRFTATLIADAARDSGNRGLDWILRNGKALCSDGRRVVLSGSPAFVHAAADTLSGAGVSRSKLESDVFSWAPG
jgi:NAD(P)H-flavin reductase